jgi:hypothetical protein
MGQVAQNLHERALLDLDEKGENIPFLAAPEAMKKLALLMDVKRRSFLRVKWAKSFETPGACALEFNVSLYNVDDIRTFADVVNFLAWQQRQMKPAPTKNGWLLITHGRNESSRTFVPSDGFGRTTQSPAISIYCMASAEKVTGQNQESAPH